MKIVFLTSYIYGSHIKNRILEFIDNGYTVVVYGFDRKNRNHIEIKEFDYHVLGTVEDAVYQDRLRKYINEFKRVRNIEGIKDVVYYLEGLDIALSFVPFNRKAKYIYEEADLVHTYKSYKVPLEWADKRIIKKSLATILTSEGFKEYHFGEKRLDNVFIIPNKLHPQILNLKTIDKKQVDIEHLRFGFVGKPRFNSVYNFIDVICTRFPNCSFEIFGGPIEEQFNVLNKYPNCHFHGYFKNPDDLPEIYQQIDLLISTYDTEFENVRYAEPNKIYEAIFFNTPIIVSSATFLAKKVKVLGIGFDINPLKDNEIVDFVNSLTLEKYYHTVNRIKEIDKKDAVNINDVFFKALNEMLVK